jgi:hypothetical protein
MTEMVEIGGEERPVNFGRNALAEYEEITGLSLLSVESGLGTFKGLRALVFVGLKWGLYKSDGIVPKPKFNLMTVGDWLDDDSMGADGPTAQILKSFSEAFPKPKNAGAAGNAA